MRSPQSPPSIQFLANGCVEQERQPTTAPCYSQCCCKEVLWCLVFLSGLLSCVRNAYRFIWSPLWNERAIRISFSRGWTTRDSLITFYSEIVIQKFTGQPIAPQRNSALLFFAFLSYTCLFLCCLFPHQNFSSWWLQFCLCSEKIECIKTVLDDLRPLEHFPHPSGVLSPAHLCLCWSQVTV